MSGITYFCIANGTVILAHASQDPSVKRLVGGITNLLSKIDISRDYDGTDATNSDEVLVRVNKGITYLLLATKGVRKTTMFTAMDNIFREFNQRYTPETVRSLKISFVLDDAFSPVILSCISNVAPSKVDMIKDDALKIRDKTFDNIEKMYQRADYLNSIADKSDNLKTSALDFSSAATKLKNDMRKKKRAAIIGGCVAGIVLIAIIVLPIVL